MIEKYFKREKRCIRNVAGISPPSYPKYTIDPSHEYCFAVR
jgi:hypothetical protein